MGIDTPGPSDDERGEDRPEDGEQKPDSEDRFADYGGVDAVELWRSGKPFPPEGTLITFRFEEGSHGVGSVFHYDSIEPPADNSKTSIQCELTGQQQSFAVEPPTFTEDRYGMFNNRDLEPHDRVSETTYLGARFEELDIRDNANGGRTLMGKAYESGKGKLVAGIKDSPEGSFSRVYPPGEEARALTDVARLMQDTVGLNKRDAEAVARQMTGMFPDKARMVPGRYLGSENQVAWLDGLKEAGFLPDFPDHNIKIGGSLDSEKYVSAEFPPSVEPEQVAEYVAWSPPEGEQLTIQEIRERMAADGILPGSPQHLPGFAKGGLVEGEMWIPQFAKQDNGGIEGNQVMARVAFSPESGYKAFDSMTLPPSMKFGAEAQFLGVRPADDFTPSENPELRALQLEATKDGHHDTSGSSENDRGRFFFGVEGDPSETDAEYLDRVGVLNELVEDAYEQSGVPKRRRVSSTADVQVRLLPVRPEGPRAFPLEKDFALRLAVDVPVKPGRVKRNPEHVQCMYEIDQRGVLRRLEGVTSDHPEASADAYVDFTKEPLIEPQQQALQMLRAEAKGKLRRQEPGTTETS